MSDATRAAPAGGRTPDPPGASPPPSPPAPAPLPPPASRSRAALARFLVACVVLLVVDLVSKSVAFEHVAGQPVEIVRDAEGRMEPIPPHGVTVVVPSVLGLHLTVNHGAVFGIGQGKRWVFVGFSLVAAVVLPWIFARTRADQWIVHLALGSVLAGALGNLHDRVVHGGVRDMLHLFPGVHLPFGWSWPGGSTELYPWIFNVADVCLVVGLAILMVAIYRMDDEEPAAGPHAEDRGAPARG